MVDFFVGAVFYLAISLPFLWILAYVLKGIAGLINLFAKLLFFLGDVARWFNRKFGDSDNSADTVVTPVESRGVTEEGSEMAAEQPEEGLPGIIEVASAEESSGINKR